VVSLAEKKSFPRSTSGLVREIGPITALFVTIAFTVGWGWQIRVFYFAGASPLPENLWVAGIPPGVMAVLLTGIIVVIMMLGYSILISAMPRSGGGYVVISRIVSPIAAFIGSWFEFFAVASDFGIIAVIVFEESFWSGGVGPALGITPVVFGYNDVGFLAGGVCLIVLFTVIATLGVRITSYVLQLLVWVPAALTLYVLYLLGLAISNPAILQNGISVWAQGHGIAGVTADSYVKAALAQGLDSASVSDYWTAVSASLLGAYFAYVGYAANTFVAGEIRNPEKNLPKIMLLAALIVVIMYAVMAGFGTYAAAAVGRTTLPNGHVWSFFDAYSYLSYGAGSLQRAGVPNFYASAPIVAAMVAAGAGVGYLNFLLFAAAILWIINDLPAFVLVASRIVFAMSFDRLLPTSLSKVNARFNAPIYATILVGIVAVLGSLAETGIVAEGGSWYPGGTLGNFFTNLFFYGVYNVDIMDAIFFSLFSLAVVLFPFRLKRIFQKASFKPGGSLGVVTIGLAGLIGNLSIAWVILTSPSGAYNILSPNSDNWFTLQFTALLGVIAALIYAYYRFGPSSKQVDYSAIFSEVPPE
jgi:APA family basic amino acid/polyamine antiporter